MIKPSAPLLIKAGAGRHAMCGASPEPGQRLMIREATKAEETISNAEGRFLSSLKSNRSPPASEAVRNPFAAATVVDQGRVLAGLNIVERAGASLVVPTIKGLAVRLLPPRPHILLMSWNHNLRSTLRSSAKETT